MAALTDAANSAIIRQVESDGAIGIPAALGKLPLARLEMTGTWLADLCSSADPPDAD